MPDTGSGEEKRPWDKAAYIAAYDTAAAEFDLPPFPGDDEALLNEIAESYRLASIAVRSVERYAQARVRVEQNRATQEPWDYKKFVECYNRVVDVRGDYKYIETCGTATLEDGYRGGGGYRTIAEYALSVWEYEQRT